MAGVDVSHEVVHKTWCISDAYAQVRRQISAAPLMQILSCNAVYGSC